MRVAPRVFIVEDDERLRRVLTRFLAREGFEVRAAGSAQDMRRRLAARPSDLILLDLMLPGEDGLSIARGLRASSDVAIIMLTGKVETADKIAGLELGADDYVTKPFDQRELLARIRSVLRRTARRRGERDALAPGRVARFDGWCADLVAHELTDPSGERVPVTGNEFQLLASLLLRRERPLSRQEIMDMVFGREWRPEDRSIDVLIAKLRRKLGDDSRHPHLIKTIRGLGYKFTADVQFS